jgi:catechol 2,3-dioxygenase-like lactoylglutathione lyase family enzyme
MELKHIHHVAILASNYEKTKEFYVEKLGFQIIRDVYREERDDYKIDLQLGDCELEVFVVKNAPQRYKEFLYLVPIPFIFYETLRFSGIAYIPLLGIVTRLRSTSFFAALYIVGTVQPIIIERNA